ncbi:MAG: hypothetical protein BGN85_05780 [Alphaproteobacteria bacterium 64-11]|mgnify:CR=1 FL=1|nr:TIGR02186 family protein [Alphaproteobacteria bacterium]OJU13858.1 MAG: hypothetical protein BGN85_05780 [Alphaproteobacteria bacterium 64-11]
MRRFPAILLLLAALAPLAWPAQAEDLVSGISQDVIQITSNYTGTSIVVFGAIERPLGAEGRDIVVVVRGPDTTLTVRKRERIAGVWVNSDAARLVGMPAFYYMASTRPLEAIATPSSLTRYGIGEHHLVPQKIVSHHDPRPFQLAALRHLEREGLYNEAPGSIDFLSETLFRTRVPVPAGVARGQYNVEVYLFRGGEVVSAQSTPLFVDQTGLERRLFNFARDAPFWYGLAAVAMSILLGWISSVLFRRPA